MPLIRLATDRLDDVPDTGVLLNGLAEIVSDVLGKPMAYVMAEASSSRIFMAGRDGESALVDVSSIGGLDHSAKAEIASRVNDLLKEALGIRGDRIYVRFQDVPGNLWGWNGRLFE